MSSSLIPGRGSPLKNATCVLHSALVAYIALQPHRPDKSTTLGNLYFHSCFGLLRRSYPIYGTRGLSINAFHTTPPVLAGARTVHDLAAALDAGFTLVRKLGGRSHQIAEAGLEGVSMDPRYSVTSPIRLTAGLGDIHGILLPELQYTMLHRPWSTSTPLTVCPAALKQSGGNCAVAPHSIEYALVVTALSSLTTQSTGIVVTWS